MQTETLVCLLAGLFIALIGLSVFLVNRNKKVEQVETYNVQVDVHEKKEGPAYKTQLRCSICKRWIGEGSMLRGEIFTDFVRDVEHPNGRLVYSHKTCVTKKNEL